MTAINVIKQRDAVHMITDGASWFFDGEFGPACAKMWMLPHLNAVVSGRGPRLAPPLIAEFLGSGGRSFDEMKRNAARLIQEATECFPEVFKGPFGSKAEFIVAGWSEASGPDAFAVVEDADQSAKCRWTTHDVRSVLMGPGDESIQLAALASLPSGVLNAEQMDPARDGLAIIEAQRAAIAVTGGRVAVGAFVQVTTVTAASINTRIIKRWDDEWGEPTVPPLEAP